MSRSKNRMANKNYSRVVDNYYRKIIKKLCEFLVVRRCRPVKINVRHFICPSLSNSTVLAVSAGHNNACLFSIYVFLLFLHCVLLLDFVAFLFLTLLA